jgi:hypothetical protein
MSFHWAEYLELARFLERQADGVSREAALRCAVSRAYYAAFCHARNYARDRLSFRPRGDGSDHGRVREHLRNTRFRRVCLKLNDLQQWRSRCDYDDSVENLPMIAADALRSAQEVILALS